MERSQYVRFDKSITGIVKGFAILFMMFLHCYGYYNYDVALNYDYSFAGFNGIFKICVGMFTFMVGYGYAFSKNKDFKYSWQHIIKLLIPFWTILFVFTVPFCLPDIYHNGIKTFIYNLFGIDSTYNYYSWFVYFFIYAMIVMPFVARFIDRRPLRNTIIVIIVAILLTIFIHELPQLLTRVFGVEYHPVSHYKPLQAFFNCLMMSPAMALGYLFARKGYYERIVINRIPRIWMIVLSIGVMIIAFIIKRNFWHIPASLNVRTPIQTDVICAPLMIGAIAVLFNVARWSKVCAFFMKLGELSVYMWFFHALFFTKAVRWFFQPAITIFNNVNLVTLWAIILTFAASWAIKTVVDKLMRYTKQ